jgi:hypothetical protein
MKISLPDFARRPAAALLAAAALTLAAGAASAQQATGAALNPAHPESYVVKRGDTLWDISAMFLQDPWYWPEIWYANPQVENPHLIYPGDVLTLVYMDGKPRLRLDRGMAGSARTGAGGTERLSPQIRESRLEDAITAIPQDVIGAFLDKGMVLEKKQIRKLPYIVALRDGHMIGGADTEMYVRGDVGEVGSVYNVVHVGEALVDPEDGDVVGYQGIYVGDGNIRRGGDPATLLLRSTNREALEGDRLVSRLDPLPLQFVPRSPARPVDGQIIHVVDGVSRIGQYQIVVLNRGQSHGLEPGNVLAAWRGGEKVDDRVDGGLLNRKVRLPDERAGIVMVFKTYDRISYALVMRAESPIHLLDRVLNPD